MLKGLRVDVNANKSAIDSEVARSTARDEAHDAAISKNASDIATETSRAKAEEAKIRQEMKTADTNLQNAITERDRASHRRRGRLATTDNGSFRINGRQA